MTRETHTHTHHLCSLQLAFTCRVDRYNLYNTTFVFLHRWPLIDIERCAIGMRVLCSLLHTFNVRTQQTRYDAKWIGSTDKMDTKKRVSIYRKYYQMAFVYGFLGYLADSSMSYSIWEEKMCANYENASMILLSLKNVMKFMADGFGRNRTEESITQRDREARDIRMYESAILACPWTETLFFLAFHSSYTHTHSE